MADRLYRDLRVGHVGQDVRGAKRVVAKVLGHGRLRQLVAQTPLVQSTFGPFFARNVKAAKGALELAGDGVVREAFLEAADAAGKVDALAESYFMAAKKDYKPVPKLIEPYQGFNSLTPHLWEAYTLCVGKYGFLDGPGKASGTYANKPGDHGYWPSQAFDVDIISHKGWENREARECFWELWNRREELNINYVILGRNIISRARPYLHDQGSNDHFNHIHVSAVH